ncbi:hypothetical protein HYV79_05435 [Candidatus Woesearchaeota archaeon]|nr:hypothetical protein [Candidatus Woesearchaeota archaeon]
MQKKWVISGAIALVVLAIVLAAYSGSSYRSDECQKANRMCQYSCHTFSKNINEARSCSLDCFALYAACEKDRQSTWKSFNFKPTWP